jgi:uncharacterized membrane protein
MSTAVTEAVTLADTAAASESGRGGAVRLLGSVSVPGVVWATAFFLSSITPSLVPRSWYLQAVASGVCAAYGYAVGVVVAGLARRVAGVLGLRITVSPRARRLLVGVGRAGLVVVAAGFWLLSCVAQGETARLVELTPPGPTTYLLGLAGTVVVFLALVLLFRGLCRLGSWGARYAAGVVGPVAARGTALVLVGLLVWFVSDAVVYRSFLEFMAREAAQVNARVPEGRTPPTSPLRSGGPGSAEAWQSLGRNGQAFVADGSRAAAIAAATGAPAEEPIRAVEDTARAAVAELRRAGGLDRSVVAVMTTTGRGWVDEWSASSIEYLTHGDSAVVAIQYSSLPSFLALLTDRQTPALAGRTLLEQVRAAVSERPPGHRPRLLVGGESLGAYGGQSAFRDADDMLRQVDGAVWVGTPNFTPLWRDLTGHRQTGSPEIAPVVGNGDHIRFVTRPADLVRDVHGRPYGTWTAPRVVYAQHASDPVSWWTPDLLADEPDWMRERAGRDVSDVRWSSFASFWQLTTDLIGANGTPPGHGHRYTAELVPAWAGVLGLDPAADYSAVQAAIARDYRPV